METHHVETHEAERPALRKCEPVPRKMAHLPVDPERGYPVPWFVDWWDGKPEFRAMDRRKFALAITQRLCWVCGLQLETRFAFVAGPMCGINRTSSEPPSHLECARWSARNCPFLNNPNMVRRQDNVINNAAFRESASGCPIARNPGVAMLWITREYEVFDDGNGKPLLMMGRPHEVEWYREGRPATRAEVNESIENGIEALKVLARQEPGGLEDLARRRKQIGKLLPAR
jgi:hypothetical protein